MYAAAGEDTAMFGGGYSFDAGAAYRGFSVDAVYARQMRTVGTSASATAPPARPGPATPPGLAAETPVRRASSSTAPSRITRAGPSWVNIHTVQRGPGGRREAELLCRRRAHAADRSASGCCRRRRLAATSFGRSTMCLMPLAPAEFCVPCGPARDTSCLPA